ncbi:ribonuclease HI [Hahella sp. SMD15-11]|uniref:ribonuclease H n=1 Tax=Thermohahella caldifontis TaxID=3142973 RepID=A0AB39UY09_9GAMM
MQAKSRPGRLGGHIALWSSSQGNLGGEPETTNNRMELMAAIEALRQLRSRCRVELYTDSQYVRKGITEWIGGWKRRGWKNAAGKPVKNQDLWQLLDDLTQKHEVHWHWVRGHSGHALNERADELANRGVTGSGEQTIEEDA